MMDMTTPMQPKPLVDATCKLGEKGCFKDGRCHALGDCENKIVTNADHLRSMSDEELANLLCTADWCETCDQMREEGTCKAMELDGPLNKHCVSAALRWLQQPYKEET